VIGARHTPEGSRSGGIPVPVHPAKKTDSQHTLCTKICALRRGVRWQALRRDTALSGGTRYSNVPAALEHLGLEKVRSWVLARLQAGMMRWASFKAVSRLKLATALQDAKRFVTCTPQFSSLPFCHRKADLQTNHRFPLSNKGEAVMWRRTSTFPLPSPPPPDQRPAP
jgi:hypothetical protein